MQQKYLLALNLCFSGFVPLFCLYLSNRSEYWLWICVFQALYPCSVCIYATEVLFGFELKLFWVQPQACWFTLHYWKAEKGWLMMSCTLLRHMLALAMTSQTPTARQTKARQMIFLKDLEVQHALGRHSAAYRHPLLQSGKRQCTWFYGVLSRLDWQWREQEAWEKAGDLTGYEIRCKFIWNWLFIDGISNQAVLWLSGLGRYHFCLPFPLWGLWHTIWFDCPKSAIMDGHDVSVFVTFEW